MFVLCADVRISFLTAVDFYDHVRQYDAMVYVDVLSLGWAAIIFFDVRVRVRVNLLIAHFIVSIAHYKLNTTPLQKSSTKLPWDIAGRV